MLPSFVIIEEGKKVSFDGWIADHISYLLPCYAKNTNGKEGYVNN